jgi:hypothetical protein
VNDGRDPSGRVRDDGARLPPANLPLDMSHPDGANSIEQDVGQILILSRYVRKLKPAQEHGYLTSEIERERQLSL